MKKKIGLMFIAIVAGILYAIPAKAEADSLSWPKEVVINNVTTTLYEPQLESYENNVLQGRMAVSFLDAKKNMQFGALWFKATLSTDLDSRTVTLTRLAIPKISFPDLPKTADVESLKSQLIKIIEGDSLELSLDRLLANLGVVENQKKTSDDNIKNTPPTIYVRQRAAILISIDGTPSFKEDAANKMEYVQNTPFFIVREKGGKTLYLKGDNLWFTASAVTGPWSNVSKVPNKIEKYADKMRPKEDQDTYGPSTPTKDTKTVVPEVIVSTTPAELILTDGAPDYATLAGTNLLYVKNTESDVIMDINTQEHYTLLSGRWFKSHTLDNGTWTFCKPSDLPADFVNIPDSSALKDVRVSVPGTDEAETALLAQSIPQTATVNRKSATVTVTYNGEPKFENINGTQITYAVNTAQTVLFASGKYYCVDKGVWFVSSTATGPWQVADKRPAGVENIPADCPVNNVKYVYIYDSTPDVVYVGYLPGYNYSYIYDGVVVYGSGYYYNPWWGGYYYPRPFTWGFGVCYSPWGGWGFSFGFSYGWMGWGFGPYWGGYWGPCGYRCGYRGGYYNGYRHGYNRGYARGYVRGRTSSHNLYNNRQGISSRTVPSRLKSNKQLRSSTKANNLVANRSGHVFQKDQAGKWNDVSKNKTKATASISDHKQFNQTMHSRSVGNSNYNNFHQSAASRMPSRGGFGGGGGFHGGGGFGGRR